MKNSTILTSLQTELLSDLLRFIDEYGWSFTVVRKTLNYKYNTNYTTDELLQFYNHLRDTTNMIASGK